MSFTSEIKKEICKEEIDAQMMKAQLCALFQMRASLHMNWQGMYLSFQTENATIAKHVFQIMKTLYNVDPRLSVLKKMQLKKNNIYRIQVFDKAQEILEDLQILTDSGLRYTPSVKMVRSEKMARAYLQGCFLASGSINSPKSSNYHLEMSSQEKDLALSVQKLMQRFYLPAKVIERKSLYVVYIKAGDKIADFLRLCNASNQITRLDNCEVANEVKSLKAAKSQLEAIEFLESNAKNIVIPEKIMHAMQIRKMYPEANLNELCLECKNEFGEDISKSGMKHRLAKVKQMAKDLKEDLDV